MIELRDYQKRIVSEAVRALDNYKIAYLAMEVRTGKTLTALSAAQATGSKKVLFATTKKAIGSIESDYDKGGFTFDVTVINHESIHKGGLASIWRLSMRRTASEHSRSRPIGRRQ